METSLIGILLTIIIGFISLFANQWLNNQRVFSILREMERRQDTFQETIESIKAYIVKNSQAQATLLERTRNLGKE